MQTARPHTRFFRLVYGSPKQSDILCGVDVRIHIVSAIYTLEVLVLSCADMVALRTSLGSICLVHDNQRYTCPLGLIFQTRAELPEAPGIELPSESPVPVFGGGADVGQILNGNTKPFGLGFHYYLFGNGVVDYCCSSPFFPFEPFQEFCTATFAFMGATFHAFGLNRTTDFSLSVPVPVQGLGRIGFAFGCTHNIGNSEVTTDKLLDIFHILFGDFHRLEKIELAFLEHKIGFPFDVRNIIGVVADKRNFLPFAYGPYRNVCTGIGKHPAVIVDAPVFLECPLCFTVKFVSVRHLAYAVYNYLSGKVKPLAYVIITKVMEPELVESLIPPRYIRNLIARSVSLLESFKKKTMLFIGWDKFDFQRQFHNANMGKKYQIFKCLKEILLTKKGIETNYEKLLVPRK